MDTKRAIKFLEECQDDNIELQEKGYDEELIKVIKLLQRGEKYERIYKKVKTIIRSHTLIWLEKQMSGLEYNYSITSKEED